MGLRFYTNPELREVLYKSAIEQWGEVAQIFMFFEEMGEAIQAVCKVGREQNNITVDELAKELADAQIMLEQMVYMFKCKDKFNEAIADKSCRLDIRLGEIATHNSSSSEGGK